VDELHNLENTDDAEKFYDFILSGSAQEIYEQYGFVPI
jgi:ABC-type molybdate transport system substrate-binding protein